MRSSSARPGRSTTRLWGEPGPPQGRPSTTSRSRPRRTRASWPARCSPIVWRPRSEPARPGSPVPSAGGRCAVPPSRPRVTWTRSAARSAISAATPSATTADSLFPPLDRRLGIPSRGPSNRRARKVCEANRAGSFHRASRLLDDLAGLHVSPKQVQLVTERIGALLAKQRDDATAAFLSLQRPPSPPESPLDLLVVTTDGGRVQTRQDSPNEKWKEDKVGVVYSATPAPEQPGRRYEGPPPTTRSVVATMDTWDTLGDHLSALADRRGYAHAHDKVFISDGAPAIRSQRERCFPNAAFVLDSYHAAQHLHADAIAGFGPGPRADAWSERQKDNLWNGRTDRVIRAIRTLSQRLGPPPKRAAPNDPRRVLATDLGYFRTNRTGLDYPTFRARGWPIGSGLIEGTIKQIGKRVKGTEKHWTLAGVEQTLQVVTHLLADDGAWEAFWKYHPRPKTA